VSPASAAGAAAHHDALEMTRTAVLAVPVGTLAAGGEMRAHLAMFVDVSDGKISAQRKYDCFEPF
jgi:hypothetical protein